MKRAPRPLRASILVFSVLLVLGSTALPIGAEEWAEVRTVAFTTPSVTEVLLEEEARVVSDPAGLVESVEGRRVRLRPPASDRGRVVVNRRTLGDLELVLQAPPRPASAANRSGSASSSSPSASSPPVPSPSSPSPTGPTPETSGPRAMAEPILDVPGSLISAFVSPFMPVPPLAVYPPTVTGGRPPVAAPITAPPRPLVLTTPPRSSGAASGSLVPAPGSSPAPSGTADPVEPVASAESTSSPPAGGTQFAALEVPAPRGTTRPVDTSIFFEITTKPGEMALFTLAQDLENRGLWGDAILQYRRLLEEYPATRLREAALVHIGHSFRSRAESLESEAIRQLDLRRSGVANEALDAAIRDYAEAIASYREMMRGYPSSISRNPVQLRIARSLHGLVRTRFQKGGIPEDSPAVVVEYLRAYVGVDDTTLLPSARLGIAKYYHDLGDARMLTRQDRVDVRRAYDRAIEEYRLLADSAPRSGEAEEALFELGRLHDRNLEMRHFASAVRYYEQLLARFPSSRYASEARERARWLKENYL